MKRPDISHQTVLEIVEQFQALSLARGHALVGGEIAKVNRLYLKIDALKTELKSRDGDQRRALHALYNHPNPQVRLEAANATLVVLPKESRAALQMIIDRREFPQAGDAGFTLLYLSDGRYVPE
ncbi:MAG: DUF2019 domain-containing protein [Hyphomicrobiales bacterium]|jgi:hypothetical protein|nr:DUF2019 domain-containing protein [Hyphomicrobiales bacterium]